MKTRKETMVKIHFLSQNFKIFLFGHIYITTQLFFGAWSFLSVHIQRDIQFTPSEGPKDFAN